MKDKKYLSYKKCLSMHEGQMTSMNKMVGQDSGFFQWAETSMYINSVGFTNNDYDYLF